MNEGHLSTAFYDCDNGNVIFFAGIHRAVLWGAYWYPLLPVVNHARHAAGQPEVDQHHALLEIMNLGFFVRSQEVHFKTNSPVRLTADDVIYEARSLCFVLERLTREKGF